MADYKAKTDTGECVFCKIIDKTIPTPGIFWEDDKFMAFLSTWPNTKGFTVVVPKDHHTSDVLNMEDGDLSEFVLAGKTVSDILKNYFEDVGRVGLIMEGTGIDHAHIKLFPMHGTGHMKRGEWKQYHSKNNTYFDAYDGHISSNDGPEADTEELSELARELRKL